MLKLKDLTKNGYTLAKLYSKSRGVDFNIKKIINIKNIYINSDLKV